MHDDRPRSLTGKTVGAYRILTGLGAGGMGEVYQARDLHLARDVAVKVLPEAFADDVLRVERFRREAQLLAALNHPNIATVYGLEESHFAFPGLGYVRPAAERWTWEPRGTQAAP